MPAREPILDRTSELHSDGKTHAPSRYVGRQPILDLRQQIFGYELLFRTSMENRFSGESDDATRQMIDNVVLLGVETLSQDTKVFVNCTREAIVERLTTLMPAHSTVIEVLETVQVDDEVIQACAELKEQGFQIALDDFLPDMTADRLIELADYIKLDFRTSNPTQLASIRKRLQGTKAALIAEKVETEAEFHRAASEGYKFFQGYFFAKPTILSSREVPVNQMIYIQLLSAISRAPTDMRQIERLIMSETSICFRLLRLVNSARMGMRSEISSVRQALIMIGEDQLRKMVTVAMAAGFRVNFKTASELILLALHRARFCELMAMLTSQTPGEQYLIGLMSVVDAILQTPMEKVLKMLPLRKEVAGVLLGEDGPAGVPLRIAQACEREDWSRCEEFCRRLRISETELSEIYVASLNWATQEMRIVGI